MRLTYSDLDSDRYWTHREPRTFEIVHTSMICTMDVVDRIHAFQNDIGHTVAGYEHGLIYDEIICKLKKAAKSPPSLSRSCENMHHACGSIHSFRDHQQVQTETIGSGLKFPGRMSCTCSTKVFSARCDT